MSSVRGYPSKSVFPAQDVSDDTHPERGFLPQLWLFQVSVCCQCAYPVTDSEKGRKKRKEEVKRKEQREQLLTATVPAAAPEDLGLADVMMLVTDSDIVPARQEFFCATCPLSVSQFSFCLPSLLDSYCLLHILFLFFPSFLPSSLSSLLLPEIMNRLY